MLRVSNIFVILVAIWLNLFLISDAQAQVKVTKANKSQFLFIGGPESFACFTLKQTDSALGALSQSRLKEGAVFKKLAFEQEKQKLNRAMTGYNVRLNRSKSSANKNLYKGKITDTKKAIARLNRASNICSTLKNSDGNDSESPKSDPTPTATPAPTPTPPAIDQNNKSLRMKTDSVRGTITNCPAHSVVSVANDKTILTATLNGCQFSFNFVPAGVYKLTFTADGYDFGKPRKLTVVSENDGIFDLAEISASELSISDYRFHWESDDVATSGYEYSATIVEPPVLVFHDNPINSPDGSSTQKLISEYNVYLSNDLVAWDNEFASRLYTTLSSIPNSDLAPSRWVLTNQELENDIQITTTSEGSIVKVSTAAFFNAQPRAVELDSVKGELFSKRLHNALTRFVTDNGYKLAAVEKILTERFSVSLIVPNYSDLTSDTTHETINSFQQFKPEERVFIINMFEEMPTGMHKTPGLRYLARRRDGLTHPLYPTAAAVAWVNYGYIEFMELTFSGSEFDARRLLIHEKSHFLWEHLFDEQLKQDWTRLGGWFQTNGAWTTNQTTGFVTPYSHEMNPNEDMAESIAYYVVNPNGLISRSPDKYNFIRDRIMKGDRYISQIRNDLTFQVYNLNPDYTYPGKIKRIDLTVAGATDKDKDVTIEVESFSLESSKDGASYGYTRVRSPDGKSFFDLYLYGTNPNAQGLSTVFRGTYHLSKFAKSGFWVPNQIQLTDNQGNSRYQKPSTFGWKLFINNSDEDLVPPAYVPGSLRLNKVSKLIDGHSVEVFVVTWNIVEVKGVNSENSALATLTRVPAADVSYSQGVWGKINPDTLVATIEIPMNPYRVSGSYGVAEIVMMDKALNTTRFRFYENPSGQQEAITTINFASVQSDITPPTIDPNLVRISAVNLHPEAPNGETSVSVGFDGFDDLSGIGLVSYTLLDPQGIRRQYYLYHSNFYSLIFNGNPSQQKNYASNIVLPVGSPPGLWGLANLEVLDKAGNKQSLNFVETVHFQVN